MALSFRYIQERLVLPYSLWMMQRPLDFYQSLSENDQQSLQPLLQKIDGTTAMEFKNDVQIARVKNQFIIIK